MIDVSQLEPHQQRMLGEYEELSARTKALNVFLESEASHLLCPIELGRMDAQLSAMRQYGRTLRARIAAFMPRTATQPPPSNPVMYTPVGARFCSSTLDGADFGSGVKS